jgi:hypothetical protein
MASSAAPNVTPSRSCRASAQSRVNHRGREARALLVGPVDHLDRCVGLVARLHQRAQRFERTEHAEHAVELAAGRLGIEVAPHRDRRDVVLARTAREHRAHVVDRHGAAERLAARLEPVAHLTVEIGQRQTADAALRRAADSGCLHQLAPQPLGIDAQVLHGRPDACGRRQMSNPV